MMLDTAQSDRPTMIPGLASDLPPLSMPFHAYQPPGFQSRRLASLAGAVAHCDERDVMDDHSDAILKDMTVGEFLEARGGLLSHSKIICAAMKASGIEFEGKILEFGAGTCKLAAHLSRLPKVRELHCVEFSENLLFQIAPRVIGLYGGDLSKFTFWKGDMNRVADWPDDLDAVVSYGAVHHLNLPDHFFSAAAKKLKPGGILFCMHEPTAPQWPLPTAGWESVLNALHESRVQGVNENVYSVREYQRMIGGEYSTRLVINNRFRGWRRYAFRLIGKHVWDALFMTDIVARKI